MLKKQTVAYKYLELLGRFEEIAGENDAESPEILSQLVPLAIEARKRREITPSRFMEISRMLGIELNVQDLLGME